MIKQVILAVLLIFGALLFINHKYPVPIKYRDLSKSSSYVSTSDTNLIIVDTIIEKDKLRVEYSTNSKSLFINFNNEIKDTCKFFLNENTVVKNFEFLINNTYHSNFIYSHNYLIICLPLLHVNAFTTLTVKIDKSKKRFYYCDALNFNDNFNYNDSTQILTFNYFKDPVNGIKKSKSAELRLKYLCK